MQILLVLPSRDLVIYRSGLFTDNLNPSDAWNAAAFFEAIINASDAIRHGATDAEPQLTT